MYTEMVKFKEYMTWGYVLTSIPFRWGANSGGGSSDVIGGINNVIGGVGTFSGFVGNLTHNELYWVQKNGILRSTRMLNNTNKIYRTSYEIVGSSLQSAKTWSNRMATLGLITTGINIAINQEVHPSDGLNAFMCGISFTGVGSLVAGGYYLIDAGQSIFTGESIGWRLDLKIEGPGGSW